MKTESPPYPEKFEFEGEEDGDDNSFEFEDNEDGEDMEDGEEAYVADRLRRREESKQIVKEFLRQVEENRFAEFPWPPDPNCPSYKYHMIDRYVREFAFENETHIGDDFEAAKKFLDQVRKSWGYDVDCAPPDWLYSPFYWIDVSNELEWRVFGNNVMKATNCVIERINAQAEEIGKTYELVNIEKAVKTPISLMLLTLTIREVLADAEKTLQAAVTVPAFYEPELEECKLISSVPT